MKNLKSKSRSSSIKRKTRETDISLSLKLDGTGQYTVSTGVPFLDHMLELFSKHSLIDLSLRAKGDLPVDYHHTVEDIGLTLGNALNEALGDRKGIRRYGFFMLPMDESLCHVALDLGGRPFLKYQVACNKPKIRDFDVKLFEEFFRGFMTQARMNLHIAHLYGDDAHHTYESIFKGLARALRTAIEIDPREKGIPSSKGKI